MHPFSTALHQISRLWGSVARCFHKAKAVSETPSSPGPLSSSKPQKNLEEPRHHDDSDFFLTDDQAHPFPSSLSFFDPSSLSFSDPSSSFGLPLSSPRRGLTSVPVETEENPSTVSYEEVLVTGRSRIAVYEDWCRVTNVSMI